METASLLLIGFIIGKYFSVIVDFTLTAAIKLRAEMDARMFKTAMKNMQDLYLSTCAEARAKELQSASRIENLQNELAFMKGKTP